MLQKYELPFLLLMLLCLAAASHPTSARDLYPKCGGDEQSVMAMANETVTLHTFGTRIRSLSLDCFAYEVLSVKGGQDSRQGKIIDYCLTEHETEYRYNLAVRATYTNEKKASHTRDFSIRDIYAGSLTGPTFRMSGLSVFSIVFTNLAVDDRCTLRLRATFHPIGDKTSAADGEAALTPALVAVRPPIAYSNSHNSTSLVLQYPKEVTPDKASMALVKLVDLRNNCQEPCPAHYMDYVAELPRDYTPLDPSQNYYACEFNFHYPGSFRVCFQNDSRSAGQELGILTVFNGNPGYYDILLPQGGDGIIFTDTMVPIKFSGYDLDTRSKGDKAKLVDERESCRGGKPAGSAPVGTNLLPQDSYGPNATYAIWEVIVKAPGAYKVCYKRKKGEWTAIPSIIEAWPSLGPIPNPKPTAFPIPVDPVTKEACPTAPMDGDPWADYTSLRFTMKKRKRLEEFVGMIVRLFCVPRSAFTVIRMSRNEAGQQVVYVVFACSGVTLQDNQLACDSIERSNYAVALNRRNSSLLGLNDIDQILGGTSIAVYGDGIDILPRARGVWATAIICVTVLACAGMMTFAVLKYRERRQYFVQFGMGDDDRIDDVYAPAMIPNETGRARPSDSIQHPFQRQSAAPSKIKPI